MHDGSTSLGEAASSSPKRGLSRRTLLAAAPVAALATAFGTTRAAAVGNSRGLTVTMDVRVDARLWDFRFRTAAMTLFEPSVRVILPTGYDQNPHRRYPVLLLLHGGHIGLGNNGNYKDWTEHGGTAHWSSDGADVIIVCPDGGNGGFYTNWKGPQGARVSWEEFHIPQLMNWIDDNFRTIVGWKTKAVAGLSMGGYGALTYAARNPEVFCSASSYSGPADVFDPGVVAVMTAAPVADGQLPGSIFQADANMMHQWNPRSRVEGFRGLRVYLSSGDGATNRPEMDSQEIVVRNTQNALSNDLNARGIGHEFNRMPYRTHEWGNWRENFSRDLPGILAALPHQ